MTWAGPSIEDLATPLAWLFGTLFVVTAAVHGSIDPDDEPVVIVDERVVTRTTTVTTTVPGNPAPTTTTSSTTGTTTTTNTGTNTATTTSTTNTGTQSTAAFDDIIWPFDSADARSGQTYQYVGLWSGAAQDRPGSPMTWNTGRIGLWSVDGADAPTSLGDMSVAVESGTGNAFGPGRECALLRLFVFDEQAELAGVMTDSSGYGHLPWTDPNLQTFTYTFYWFGEGQAPSNCNALPGTLSFFRESLRGLLQGRYPGEGAGLSVDSTQYFDLYGWGDLTITGRLDGLRAT